MRIRNPACSIESYPGTGSTLIPPVGSEGFPDGRGLHARLLHLLTQQVRGGARLQYMQIRRGPTIGSMGSGSSIYLNADTDRDPAVFGTDPEPRIRTSG
jgi:hypothetical protein